LRIFAAVRALIQPTVSRSGRQPKFLWNWRSLLTASACCLLGTTQGQNTILLMNGQVIETPRLLGQSTLEIRYLEKRKDRLIERNEPTEGVFSVVDSLKREKIWYFQDTVFGNDLSVPQMRWFIKGEQDARAGYRPLGPVLGGFLGSAGLVIGLDLEFISIPIPLGYAALMSIPRVKVTRGSITDPLMEGDDSYAYGYGRAGKSKRVWRCLLSSAAGVAVGLAVRQLIINPNNPVEY
jgi:hypothetical protein